MVWADPTNNALVITAPPKIMRAVMDIVDKLDIRRPQVLVEAIIAEVDVDKSAELGINWAAFSRGDNVPAGAVDLPTSNTTITTPARTDESAAKAPGALIQGTSVRSERSAPTVVNIAPIRLPINKRTITTTVLIEDGGVVVLGGLIEDNSVKGEQRVPYLGNIPLIGLLFKTRNATSTKNNLILFIRPKILRDPSQAAFETDLKYNYMMDQQKDLSRREALPLLPGVSRGKLEPPPPPPKPGNPTPAPESGAAPEGAAPAPQSSPPP